MPELHHKPSQPHDEAMLPVNVVGDFNMPDDLAKVVFRQGRLRNRQQQGRKCHQHDTFTLHGSSLFSACCCLSLLIPVQDGAPSQQSCPPAHCPRYSPPSALSLPPPESLHRRCDPPL